MPRYYTIENEGLVEKELTGGAGGAGWLAEYGYPLDWYNPTDIAEKQICFLLFSKNEFETFTVTIGGWWDNMEAGITADLLVNINWGDGTNENYSVTKVKNYNYFSHTTAVAGKLLESGYYCWKVIVTDNSVTENLKTCWFYADYNKAYSTTELLVYSKSKTYNYFFPSGGARPQYLQGLHYPENMKIFDFRLNPNNITSIKNLIFPRTYNICGSGASLYYLCNKNLIKEIYLAENFILNSNTFSSMGSDAFGLEKFIVKCPLPSNIGAISFSNNNQLKYVEFSVDSTYTPTILSLGSSPLLETVLMPAYMPNITTLSVGAGSSQFIKKVRLPISINPNCINFDSMFCMARWLDIGAIENVSTLSNNNTAVQCSYDSFSIWNNCPTALTITSQIKKFVYKGENSTNRSGLYSLRLPNQGSLFAGTSPQIDVSNTMLDATALNQLFTDLPTLTGKIIKITSALGATTCDKSIANSKGWTVT